MLLHIYHINRHRMYDDVQVKKKERKEMKKSRIEEKKKSMRHSSIIPDKDLTCKIDFNGKQQQQTDRHIRSTQAYKKEHIALAAKVISIIVQRVFCFAILRLYDDDDDDKNNSE